MCEKVKTIILRRIIVFFLILIVACLSLFLLSAYLSKTEKVKANILIVEGWMPPDEIRSAYDEYKNGGYDLIITTGMKPTFEGCTLYENGFLVFYPGKKFISDTLIKSHLIEIDAYSSTGGENSARFNFYINKSQIASITTSAREKKYPVRWDGRLSGIDSLTVQFFNDKHSEFRDRNLYVRNIIIDHSIPIPVLNYSEYDRGRWDGKNRIKNNVSSNAQQARNLLISFGADSLSVIAVPGKRVKINRTLTSALALRDWLLSSDIKISGINIVSSGSHARRTWMTYNKVLNKNYRIGIIALPVINCRTVSGYVLKTLREGVAIIYYWFLLLPY